MGRKELEESPNGALATLKDNGEMVAREIGYAQINPNIQPAPLLMSDSKQCSRDEWPIKAYKDLSFLNSEAARNIRVLAEMTEPGLRFAEEQIKDTIVN